MLKRFLNVCAALVLALCVTMPAPAAARSHGSGSTRHYSRAPRGYTPRIYTPRGSSGTDHGGRSPAVGVPRDSHGRIQRSEAEKHAFEKESGYPHARPGYVVDHILPLARGGADAPRNMQWQTKADAKAKDKVELGPPKHHATKGQH